MLRKHIYKASLDLYPLPFLNTWLNITFLFFHTICNIYFEKKIENITPFLWCHRYFLFWTSGDVCPGFQARVDLLTCMFLSPVHNIFLRFRFGATPAQLLVANVAVEPFRSTYLHWYTYEALIHSQIPM